MSSTILKSIVAVLLLLKITVAESQSLTFTDICPRNLIIEKGDRECSSPTQIGPREVFAGKELQLTNQSRVVEVEYLAGLQAYECRCDYAIFPENRELIDCSDGEPVETSVVNSFYTTLVYRWIEPPINTETNCSGFRSNLASSPNPTYFAPQFDFFIGSFLNNSFPGIANTEKAVMMASPYSNSRWFSHDYIVENYSFPMDVIANVAVSYETCEPEQPAGVFLVDLNPEFYENGLIGSLIDPIITIDDLLNVESPESLEGVISKFVNGTTADGSSKTMVVVSSEGFDEISIQDSGEENGTLEFPWGRGTFEFSGGRFFIAIYTPPNQLPNANNHISQEGLAFQTLSFDARLHREVGDKEVLINIPLIRPPVILSHGTFDNPENCWKTPLAGEKSMYQHLVDENYKVFTLDYSGTNGSQKGPCPGSFLFSSDALISSFYCNRTILFDNPGGISEALSYYRNTLNVAVTQVDVVGHSMGGIIPRVYASDSDDFDGYNTDGYYRTDNFEEGDINRLITIASTHMGSDLSEFQTFLNQSWSDSRLPILERLSNFTTTQLLWFGAGVGETGAVLDQQPYSPGLRRIGPTPIPSHAIVCTVKDIRAMEENEGDPNDFATYANLYRGTSAYFYFFPGVIRNYLFNFLSRYDRLPSSLRTPDVEGNELFTNVPADSLLQASRLKNRNAYIDLIIDNLSQFWQDWHILQEGEDEDWIVDVDRFELDYTTAEYNHYEGDDQFDDLIRARDYDFISGEKPYSSTLNESDQSSADFLRYLIFKNDLNDGVVRRESQIGGLNDRYISDQFDNHIHSYAPRYPDVIERVDELLRREAQSFAPEGFPTTDSRGSMAMPELNQLSPEKSASIAERFGCEAKCWSGMVPSHADAFLNIAIENDLVLLCRPVNPDATPLIDMGAATKGLNLKGKSANWGPQKGYIPVNQRYSKIWNLYGDDIIRRDTQIVVFSAKTTNQLQSSPDEVVQRHFTYQCEDQGQVYQVYFDTLIADAEQSVFLVQSQSDDYLIKRWNAADNGACPSDEGRISDNLDALTPMYVMSRPRTSDTLFYTADYDLLAIGFYDRALDGYEEDPYDVPTLSDFNATKGLITPRQELLLDQLNEEVAMTGYEGGDVSHHGPENQFYVLDKPADGSPYIDYPIIAFYPENGRGVIHAIPKGPENFRDRPLKRFMAEKRREGFDLYENLHSPGWSWSHFRPYNYDQGWDDRDDPNLSDSPEMIPFPSNCSCGETETVVSDTSDEMAAQLDLQEQLNTSLPFDYTPYPNPATNLIQIDISAKKEMEIEYNIVNLNGNLVRNGILKLSTGQNNIKIEVSDLIAGNYFLMLSSESRIMSKMIHINN